MSKKDKIVSSKNWDQLSHGLLVPQGYNKGKREVRKNFNELPLQTMKKTKVVDIPRPVLVALNMEMEKLVSKWLDESNQWINVIKFEEAAQRLGEEYGVTIVIGIIETEEGPTINIDTEEILNETAGEVEQYQQFSDKFHGGAKVKDDIEILRDPNASDRDNRLLE